MGSIGPLLGSKYSTGRGFRDQLEFGVGDTLFGPREPVGAGSSTPVVGGARGLGMSSCFLLWVVLAGLCPSCQDRSSSQQYLTDHSGSNQVLIYHFLLLQLQAQGWEWLLSDAWGGSHYPSQVLSLPLTHWGPSRFP